ncbi:GNAT family N-acetyltransferase [Paenibacillus amylolyticus]|uniref:GNAT family N-acetyltransferase n=1 Tax=Paenibacillus amylolyticus TaxID=1451 RepID=UPI001059C219|nr:GNAT family N-acetyltransferase [Paenibacillus amylolyticus]
MEYLVREIHITDYQDICLLNRDFNSDLSYFSEEKVKEKIEIITRETKDKIFVFELHGEIVGYIHGSRYELLFADPLINVLGFVVKEGYRNQGIGSKLMDYLEHWARGESYSGIKLLSHPSREQAHRLYQKRGYQFTKDQKNFIKFLDSIE